MEKTEISINCRIIYVYVHDLGLRYDGNNEYVIEYYSCLPWSLYGLKVLSAKFQWLTFKVREKFENKSYALYIYTYILFCFCIIITLTRGNGRADGKYNTKETANSFSIQTKRAKSCRSTFRARTGEYRQMQNVRLTSVAITGSKAYVK